MESRVRSPIAMVLTPSTGPICTLTRCAPGYEGRSLTPPFASSRNVGFLCTGGAGGAAGAGGDGIGDSAAGGWLAGALGVAGWFALDWFWSCLATARFASISLYAGLCEQPVATA